MNQIVLIAKNITSLTSRSVQDDNVEVCEIRKQVKNGNTIRVSNKDSWNEGNSPHDDYQEQSETCEAGHYTYRNSPPVSAKKNAWLVYELQCIDIINHITRGMSYHLALTFESDRSDTEHQGECKRSIYS